MFTRSVLKTLVLNTICTVCITQEVCYTGLLCVKYGMHAYAGPACICRMHAPSMLFPPTQPKIQHATDIWTPNVRRFELSKHKCLMSS